MRVPFCAVFPNRGPDPEAKLRDLEAAKAAAESSASIRLSVSCIANTSEVKRRLSQINTRIMFPPKPPFSII